MNSDSTQASDQGSSPQGAARATVLDGFDLFTDTHLVDTPWEVNRRIYEAWRIFDPWPRGLLFHLAGPTGTGVRIQSVWRSAQHESEHMTTIGAERFTDVVGVLVGELGISVPDMLPVNSQLRSVSFGPLARNFVDIGPDLDESVGRQFGTVLTAVDFDHGSLADDQLNDLWQQTGTGESSPEAMITQFSWRVGEATYETQLWQSEELARAHVEGVLGPQLARVGRSAEELAIGYREITRMAIASSELGRQLP